MALAYANGVYGVVAVAPSPATSGTSITLSVDTSALFPDPAVVGNYPISIWPTGFVYIGGSGANHGEICTVTAQSGSMLTVTRAVEGSTARAIVLGDQVQMAPTADTFNNFKASSLIVSSPGAVIQLGMPAGQVVSISDGSAGTPVTVDVSTVTISRYETTTGPTAHSAAITAEAIGNNNAQPTGVRGIGYQLSNNGDALGVSGEGTTNGNAHTAYGLFGYAEATTVGGSAISLQTAAINSTGVDSVYSDGLFVGLDIFAGGAGGKKSSVAFQTRGPWDGGIRFIASSIASVSIADEASAATSILISGAHSNAAIQIINNAGNYMQRWKRTSSTASEWGMALLTTGELEIDDITNARQAFRLGLGTPGAGNTGLWISQGAGPTLSQVKLQTVGGVANVLTL